MTEIPKRMCVAIEVSDINLPEEYLNIAYRICFRYQKPAMTALRKKNRKKDVSFDITQAKLYLRWF